MSPTGDAEDGGGIGDVLVLRAGNIHHVVQRDDVGAIRRIWQKDRGKVEITHACIVVVASQRRSANDFLMPW